MIRIAVGVVTAAVTAAVGFGTPATAAPRVQDVVENTTGNVGSGTLGLSHMAEAVAWQTVVDDGSPGFRVTISRNWPCYLISTAYNGAVCSTSPADIDDYATYSADLPESGSYQVEAWYPVSSSANNRTPYIILNLPGLRETVYVDQRSGGGTWVNLGTYYARTGGAQDVVAISRRTSGTGTIYADAIRITKIIS